LLQVIVEVGMSKIFWLKDSLHLCNTDVDCFLILVGVYLCEAYMGQSELIMEAGEMEIWLQSINLFHNKVSTPYW